MKSVAAFLPVHEARLQTYLRMSGLRVALILNPKARRLTEGIRRYWMNSNVWFSAGKI